MTRVSATTRRNASGLSDSGRSKSGKSIRGFTLIEMVLVVGILAIMYGLGSAVLYELQRPREDRAKLDLRTLVNGLYGREPGEHGYLADMGELPQPVGSQTLNEFLSRPPAPNPLFEVHENFISAGWHGPYASFDTAAVNQDPWGNPWFIQGDGRIRSLGRDGIINTTDDLVMPDYAPLPRDSDADGIFDVRGSVAVIVVDPETGERVADATRVMVTVSNVAISTGLPESTLATLESSVSGFVADDITPGRKRIDVEGLLDLAGASAYAEVLLPVGGVTSVTVPLRRDILP